MMAPDRSSGEAVPKRTGLLCKLCERRNVGAPTPELRIAARRWMCANWLFKKFAGVQFYGM